MEAFALLPPGPAVDLLDGALPPTASVLDLGCGAGRLSRALTERGHLVIGVDQCPEMLARAGGDGDPASARRPGMGSRPGNVNSAGGDGDPASARRPGMGPRPGNVNSAGGFEAQLADIEGLDLGRRFDAVVLASFLVNTTDTEQRDAFLHTCARHVAADGAVYLQRLDPELVPIAVDAESEEYGVSYAMEDVRHDGRRFAVTMRFTIDGTAYSHRYTGIVLGDGELAEALSPHGLSVSGYLDGQRTWVEARP